MRKPLIPVLALLLIVHTGFAQKHPQPPAVIGYYAGRSSAVDSFPIGKLTHIIYSFCHLKGNRLAADRASDTVTIQRLVALKVAHPGLKVILSLGGWSGCKTCPDVFATSQGRKEFVASVKEMADFFHTDGIDIDWEYPSLPNAPGFPYYAEDKDHFTALIKLLRKKLDRNQQISFAAGGLTKHLKASIDWKKVSRRVNYINLMSYDLVSGYDTISGHHTPLYSTPRQEESTDRAVRWLDSAGVPLNKVAIGLAMYARIFAVSDTLDNGIYRPCHFYHGVSYRDQARVFSKDSGYVFHWDSTAQAPWLFNAARHQFVTYDDSTSIRLKTQYALDRRLGGVMFWQLAEDRTSGGLLDVIDDTKKAWLDKQQNQKTR